MENEDIIADLPKAFVERMKKQLPEHEWEALFAVYGKSPYKGLRVNALKISARDFAAISPFPLSPVPWEKNGFYVQAEKSGSHSYHFAGLYYSQEPSAMCAAPLLDAKPGERVLDLCSAPGGKGTQLAAAMNGEGLLVLNEPISSRAKILSRNVERLGVKNAFVLSSLPEKLSSFFVAFFDKILVDAPCSGEGMFRKNAEEAIGEWSEENVAFCAVRQAGILDEATKMLRVGGRLVYSTCTFSEEEDERQVSDYLSRHSEMRLVKTEKLYPHRVAGEGHFAALFEKCVSEKEGDGGAIAAKRVGRETNACAEGKNRARNGEEFSRVSPTSEKAYRAFEKDFFFTAFVPARRLYEMEATLYALPEGAENFPLRFVRRFGALRVGVRLGEVKNGRFEPSHSLAMCVRKTECKNTVDFTSDDPRTEKFLCGEAIFCGERENDEKIRNGWLLVCTDGYPVGFGKAVNGLIKNHIPKGLRKTPRKAGEDREKTGFSDAECGGNEYGDENR